MERQVQNLAEFLEGVNWWYELRKRGVKDSPLERTVITIIVIMNFTMQSSVHRVASLRAYERRTHLGPHPQTS